MPLFCCCLLSYCISTHVIQNALVLALFFKNSFLFAPLTPFCKWPLWFGCLLVSGMNHYPSKEHLLSARASWVLYRAQGSRFWLTSLHRVEEIFVLSPFCQFWGKIMFGSLSLCWDRHSLRICVFCKVTGNSTSVIKLTVPDRAMKGEKTKASPCSTVLVGCLLWFSSNGGRWPQFQNIFFLHKM